MLSDLPIEILRIIILNLSSWESLQLRHTSRFFYCVVTNYQSYWYRHFCGYLIKHKKKAAMYQMQCKREHVAPYSIDCLTLDDEIKLAQHLNIDVCDLPTYLNEDSNKIYEHYQISCMCANHYFYDIPENRMNIQINADDFHPNDQIYCYRYLIHNYRQQRNRAAKYTKEDVKQQLKQLSYEKKEFQKIVQLYKTKINKLNDRQKFVLNIRDQLTKMQSNKVFLNQRSRKYINPLLLLN